MSVKHNKEVLQSHQLIHQNLLRQESLRENGTKLFRKVEYFFSRESRQCNVNEISVKINASSACDY